MKPATIDPKVVSAIASTAIFYELCPDGLAGKSTVEHLSDPDCRWPEDNAYVAVGIDRTGSELMDTTAFTHGLELGLQLGARIGADPFHRPEVKDLLKQCRADIAQSYADAREDAA